MKRCRGFFFFLLQIDFCANKYKKSNMFISLCTRLERMLCWIWFSRSALL